MKTERRHELQQNELATQLNQAIGTVRPYSRLIVGVLIAVVVGLGVWWYWSAHNRASRAEQWNELLLQGIPYRINLLEQQGGRYQPDFKLLESLASEGPVGNWALLVTGDIKLSSSEFELLTKREQGKEQLDAAIDAYRNLLARTTPEKDPVLQQVALWGIGRAQESLGQLDKAGESYQKLLDTWPEGVYAQTAKVRLEAIKKQDTIAFYSELPRLVQNRSSAPSLFLPPPGESSKDNGAVTGQGGLSDRKIDTELPESIDKPFSDLFQPLVPGVTPSPTATPDGGVPPTTDGSAEKTTPAATPEATKTGDAQSEQTAPTPDKTPTDPPAVNPGKAPTGAAEEAPTTIAPAEKTPDKTDARQPAVD